MRCGRKALDSAALHLSRLAQLTYDNSWAPMKVALVVPLLDCAPFDASCQLPRRHASACRPPRAATMFVASPAVRTLSRFAARTALPDDVASLRLRMPGRCGEPMDPGKACSHLAPTKKGPPLNRKAGPLKLYVPANGHPKARESLKNMRALHLALVDADDLVEHVEGLGARALEGVAADDRAVGAAVAQAADLGEQAFEVLRLAA